MKYYNFMMDGEDEDIEPLLFEINTDTLWFNRYDLEKGIFMEMWDEEKIEVLFDKNKGDEIEDYALTDVGWFVVTEKFKEVLETLNLGNYQFLPLKAKSKTDDETIDLYVLNICNIVDAIDEEHSKYSQSIIDGKLFRSLTVVALKGSELGEYDIFRLKGEEFDIIVSENFKKAIKKNKITGCDFLELKVI